MTSTKQAPDRTAGADIFTRLFTVLRIFTGLVWLSNGLAKTFGTGSFDLGFFSFTLIDKGSAKNILTGAASRTGIRPLGDVYQNLILAHWGFWSVFLNLAELAVGIGLVLGVATRLAAVGGLLLIGPIWIMLWHTHLYLWEYPAEDLFPLVLLAIAPAGRQFGMDQRLSGRFGHRWPF
jgi:thiosulfate dehydrogenase [quinone] large subunit